MSGRQSRPAGVHTMWMTSVVNINDVLDGHVVLDIECVDRLYLNAYVRHEAPFNRAGMKGPACGLSQQPAEAEGSLTLEAQGRVGAALTTTGRVGTARRPGSVKQDGKVYECRTSG